MTAPAKIISELAAVEARIVVEGDRVRVMFPEDRPPPPDLIEAARAHRDSLRTFARENQAAGQAYARTVAALRAICPEHVEAADWQQAVADADTFLATWAAQAVALEWSAPDLFGLHPVPERPGLTYRRLSRRDCTGLIWFLHGRSVVALTASEAAIQAKRGSTLVYRKSVEPEAQGHRQ
jgi:hypothetical protein